jgi:hypothetical protein
MKNLRQLCAGAILILTLAVFTYADDGHVPCPGVTAPPPMATISGDILQPIVETIAAVVLSLA